MGSCAKTAPVPNNMARQVLSRQRDGFGFGKGAHSPTELFVRTWNYNTRPTAQRIMISESQCVIVAPRTPVVPNVGAQTFDAGSIATDSRLIFPNLPPAGVMASIKFEPVPVLLELPLTALQLTLIRTQVNCATCLSEAQ